MNKLKKIIAWIIVISFCLLFVIGMVSENGVFLTLIIFGIVAVLFWCVETLVR